MTDHKSRTLIEVIKLVAVTRRILNKSDVNSTLYYNECSHHLNISKTQSPHIYFKADDNSSIHNSDTKILLVSFPYNVQHLFNVVR